MSIDRYDPIRILGEGSFGKVYLMRDKVKRNFVCVKIIKIKNIPKKERDATKMEVDLLRKLNHPNIVRYVDSFLSKNKESLCICMEYCDGGDLASQIKAARRNLFSESKILHWFVQLALGLHYMHSNKVLHRDLKTQNVFMLGNGRLVLGDLGISKVLDGTMDMAQTCIGTPYYMSPEIFKNKPYSYKSDVWALGCVLYEMTTLNHAFDAQSINGLATKIVKGKYPPISPKYSKYLSDLIQAMLQINPQQRPDLDQILRKSFIKKHIVNFFSDIASRPSNSLGEGTMIFKVAVGGPLQNNAALGNDSNMISLRQQLQTLGMTEEITSALAPKAMPLALQDDAQAIKLAKEQANALQREKEHKRMVEAALEKLRLERESRAAMVRNPGNDGGQKGVGNPIPSVQAPRPSGYQIPGRNARIQQQVAPPVQPQQQQQQVQQKRPIPIINDQMNRKPQPSYGDDNSSVGSNNNNAIRRKEAGRRSSFGEDNVSIQQQQQSQVEKERERKAMEERKRQLQHQEESRLRAVAVADEKRKEEARIEARAREDAARIREEVAEKRAKEEISAKLKIEQIRVDQIRAQAEMQAKAKREAMREKERQRQRDEIEQLKRDKIELDRRTNERDRVRDERRAQERIRIEGNRKEQMDVVQDKLYQMNEQIQQIPPYRGAHVDNNNHNRLKDESKHSDELSAREKVLLRRQEKQAKEEQERLDALRNAENENRRIRQEAQYHGRFQNYGENDKYGFPIQQPPPQPISQQQQQSEGGGYEFDSSRSKQQQQKALKNNAPPMDMNELSDRLNDINKGIKGNSAHNADVYGKNAMASNYDSGSASDDNESEIWEAHKNQAPGNLEEEEEDMVRREEELRAELNFATCRVEELKRTLEETKSFLGPRLPTRGKTPGIVRGKTPAINQSNFDDGFHEDDVEDELDDDDYYESDDPDDIQEDPELVQNSHYVHHQQQQQQGIKSNRPSQQSHNNNEIGDATVRMIRPQEPAISSHAYGGLQDLPSPSGRLSDRIDRLRQRCTEALGREAFREAYLFLKQHEEESLGFENGRDLNDDDYEAKKIARMRFILGEGKAHYMSLIEQLIFMEETHLG